MYKINLTNKEKKGLKLRKKKEKNNKILKRLQCVDLKNKKFSNNKIADILDITNDTVTIWIKLFLEQGFDGLCKLHYEGRRPSQLDPYQKKIKAYVKTHNVSKAVELQDWLKNKYNITIEHSWFTRYCKKNFIFLTRKHA